MRRLPFVIADIWRVALVATIIATSIVALYIFKLGTLVGGMDTQEFTLWQQISQNTIQPLDILRNAAWLPHTLWLYLLQVLPISNLLGVYALRGFSVLVALLAIASFYVLLRRWYSLRIAILGTILLAVSSWMLYVGRYASQQVLYLLPLIALAAWSQVQAGRHRAFNTAVAFITIIVALYVPGLVWLVIPAVVWQRRAIRKAFRSISPGVAISVLIFGFILIVPLIGSIAWPLEGTSSLQAVKTFAGIPLEMPPLQVILQNLLGLARAFLLSSGSTNTLFTGHLPLLGLFGSVMFVLGLYDFYRNSFHLDRTKIISIYILLGVGLIALYGLSVFAVLIPIVFLIIANGIRYMLHEWFNVFPRNPLARSVGVGVITVAVALSVGYHLVTYFVAWPHDSATKSTFVQKL